jgi:RNA polymerase sigma-70 factor (ECF subfamily)
VAGSADRDTLERSSDEALMTLWVESRRRGRGVTRAFDLLWRRHRDATFRVASRILGSSRSLAEDVVQDAWLEVARASYWAPGSFRAFIRTVAVRKALDRMEAIECRKAADDALEWLYEPTERPDARAHARRGASALIEAARKLPATQRVAWSSRYLHELTFTELARETKVPLGTAKTRVRLANAAMSSALDRRGLARAELIA